MIDDRDKFYLQHILEACVKIGEYTSGFDAESFLKNSVIQDAVIRQLEIVGEATKQVSPKLRADYPQVRWSDIAGMRDRLIHGYFSVDLETVWVTVENDVPDLREHLSKIL